MSELPLNEEMLPAARRQHLIEWFEANHSGASQELARMFGISVSTIRRDLDVLASEGLVKRTHGGAVAVRNRATWEPSTDVSRRTAVEEKQAIVREALRFVSPNQSLLIDTGGVVCHLLADELAKLSMPLTVITNDLYVAGALTYHENIKLHVPGGPVARAATACWARRARRSWRTSAATPSSCRRRRWTRNACRKPPSR